MRRKRKGAVSIIGGADGPTAVFLVGGACKKSFKARVQTYLYKRRRKRAEKKITAGTHSLAEVADYAMKKYHAIEMNPHSISFMDNVSFMENKNSVKERLIRENKPELLADIPDIPASEFHDEEAVKKVFRELEKRSERIAEIPDNEINMDFHMYKISLEGGSLEFVLDYEWDIFFASYSGNQKEMKQLKKICDDLYLYYGVSEKDIMEKTERYSALLAELSS
ncbi:MAG: hypothetical protein Q4B85_07365 [Lachnospiraceae bacterium]|nr:hypothetical protein [Lachnospiraceae bacterium]